MAPPPSFLIPWTKTLFAYELNAGRVLEHLYDYVYVFEPTETVEWRRFQLTCEDLNDAVTGDDAQCTFDFMNYTGGNIDPSWTQGDYDSIKTKLTALLTPWAAVMGPGYSFTTLRAYVRAFNPQWAGSPSNEDIPPFVESGAPDWETTIGLVGGGVGRLPGQVAMSVTEQVPVRTAWGRFYLPFAGQGAIEGATGRMNTGTVSSVITAVHQAYQDLANIELYPIVVHTQQAKARVAAWSQVTSVRGDDVPDIVRRRRVKYALFHKILPAPSAAATQPAASGEAVSAGAPAAP